MPPLTCLLHIRRPLHTIRLHVTRCSSVLYKSGAQDFRMAIPSFQHKLHASRLISLLTLATVAFLVELACPGATAWAQTAEKKTDLAIRPEFREPVVLGSKEGVLEVRLTARQGQSRLDTVATPVQNFLLFDYEVIHGAASNGQKSGGNLYPAPTLQVFPGERLIVHFENGLSGLTVRDYFIPQYTPKDQPVPLYPEQMTSSPINLHTHGAHISPKGNADNVMLHIRRGCRTPSRTTSRGTYRKGCTGITVIFMGSPRRRSMRVSWVCLRSDERMATCRSSPRKAFPSATWRCSTISSLTAPAVWPNSTI